MIISPGQDHQTTLSKPPGKREDLHKITDTRPGTVRPDHRERITMNQGQQKDHGKTRKAKDCVKLNSANRSISETDTSNEDFQ